MKYLKSAFVIVAIFAIIGIGKTNARSYNYAIQKLPISSGYWQTPEEKQKKDEYSNQALTNSSAVDALKSEFSISAYTRGVHTIKTKSKEITVDIGKQGIWDDTNDNKRVNSYDLYVRTARYNALPVTCTFFWKIDDQPYS